MADPPVAVPPGFAPNSLCANGIPLTVGTLADQDLSLGAAPADRSCVATHPTSLFYAITIPARSVVAVRADALDEAAQGADDAESFRMSLCWAPYHYLENELDADGTPPGDEGEPT